MNAETHISDSEESMRAFMDEKITIEGGINPAREHELGALLQNLEGVEKVTVAGDDLSITYEPTQITSKEIHERLKGTGFTPGDRAVAPADPPVGR